jgi:hypothetical protein
VLSQRIVHTLFRHPMCPELSGGTEKLGFKPLNIEPSGSMYDAGGGSSFLTILPMPARPQTHSCLSPRRTYRAT